VTRFGAILSHGKHIILDPEQHGVCHRMRTPDNLAPRDATPATTAAASAEPGASYGDGWVREVFVVSQPWGHTVFHFVAECLPKVFRPHCVSPQGVPPPLCVSQRCSAPTVCLRLPYSRALGSPCVCVSMCLCVSVSVCLSLCVHLCVCRLPQCVCSQGTCHWTSLQGVSFDFFSFQILEVPSVAMVSIALCTLLDVIVDMYVYALCVRLCRFIYTYV